MAKFVPLTSVTNRDKIVAKDRSPVGATAVQGPKPDGAGPSGTANVDFTNVTNKPTTLAGYGITDAIVKENEPANTVLAGPASGADAEPTFRPLVADDLPDVLNDAGTGFTLIADADTGKIKRLKAGSGVSLSSDSDSVTIDATGGGGGGASLDSDGLIAATVPLAWFKADDGVEVSSGVPAADTDAVLNWLDQSGNGYNLTQATSAQRPTFRTNILNSLPVVRFDGSNDNLFASLFPSIDLGNMAFILVAKSTSASNNQRFFVIGASGSGNDYDDATRMEVEVADGAWNFRAQGGTASEFTATYTGSRPTPIAVYSVRLEKRMGSIVRNGCAANDSSIGNDVSTSLTNSPTGLLMGCAYVSSAIAPTTVPLAGDIAELVIFNRAVSDAKLGLIADALRQKWGI